MGGQLLPSARDTANKLKPPKYACSVPRLRCFRGDVFVVPKFGEKPGVEIEAKDK
jgi:hypothetical protein